MGDSTGTETQPKGQQEVSRGSWVYTSGGWAYDERKDERQVVLHLVRNSATLCGIPTYELEHTSTMLHYWTGTTDDDANLVNCASCKKRRPP